MQKDRYRSSRDQPQKTIYTMRQEMTKRLRKSRHQQVILQRRQEFLRLYSIAPPSKPTLSFQQVKDQILQYFGTTFTQNKNQKYIEYLKWYPNESFESKRIVNFIRNVMETTESEKTKKEIFNLMSLFVQEQKSNLTFSMLNIFDLIRKVEYLPIWVHIADIENKEIKVSSMSNFKMLCQNIVVENLDHEQEQLLAEVIYKLLYKSTFEAHNCYFFFPYIKHFLQSQSQTILFCYAAYSLDVFFNHPVDIKVTIANGVLKQLFNQLSVRTHQCQLSASLSIASKIFEHDSNTVKAIFYHVGNAIDLFFSLLKQHQSSKIRASCIFILGNIIADNQNYAFQCMEKGLMIFLEELFFSTKFPNIKNQIIEYLYTLLQTAGRYELIGKIVCNNVMGILCDHIQKTQDVNVRLKCLVSIGQYFELTREMDAMLEEEQRVIVEQDIEQYRVKDLMEEMMCEEKHMAEMANQVLTRCLERESRRRNM